MESNDREIWDGEWIGVKAKDPLCMSCKYADGRFCTKYQKDRLEVPFELSNCPGFTESDDVKAKQLFKGIL